jgi:hypothetical protein
MLRLDKAYDSSAMVWTNEKCWRNPSGDVVQESNGLYY